VCLNAEWMLPCRASSVAYGRRIMGMHFRAWGLDERDPAWATVEDVLLVASELVGNAVRVCLGPIGVGLEVHRADLVITIRDDSPAAVAARQEPAPTHVPSGRGLQIVSQLSVEWGQTPYDGGSKQVWARVQVPGGSVLAEHCRR
jgi:hypothetical protein